ncbi:MAG: hypothetical protein ACR2LC_09860 [Pyrinomonadaceae bacterium]
MPHGKIDLNELADRLDHQLSIVPREEPAERQARLEIEKADAAHKRRIDLALHITTLAVIAATFGVCVYIILARTFSSDMDKLAAALLTSIVTGLVGYVTGRASK